jgi:hypothetical protein
MSTNPVARKAAVVEVTATIPAERLDAFHRLVDEFRGGRGRYDHEAQAAAQAAADVHTEGVAALQRLYQVAQGDSGQCRHIARFLVGLYNGQRFPFDLTDLRCIDTKLFNDCLAVLRMDARPKREVHTFFEDGGRKWEAMIERRSMVEVASLISACRELVDRHTSLSDEALHREIEQLRRWLRYEYTPPEGAGSDE